MTNGSIDSISRGMTNGRRLSPRENKIPIFVSQKEETGGLDTFEQSISHAVVNNGNSEEINRKNTLRDIFHEAGDFYLYFYIT
jgi:hypothetical protein